MLGNLIVLDADGVLLDYHSAYASAWARAFGVSSALRDPQAYWPLDRWALMERAELPMWTFMGRTEAVTTGGGKTEDKSDRLLENLPKKASFLSFFVSLISQYSTFNMN